MSFELSYRRFKLLTGINVNKFMKEFVNFVANDVQKISDYFSGKIRTPQTSFTELERLLVMSRNILTGYNLHQGSFLSIMDWEVLDSIETIRQQLINVSVISKYLRSSIILATYNDGLQESEYIQKQNQTLENVSWDVLRSNNPNNDWVKLAIDNDLIEEDYTMRGGVSLSVTYRNPGTVNFVEVVVDNIVDENIMGKDIYQVLTFINDDLQVLDPEGTTLQSANVLVSLKRGDNPEFWMQGLPNLVGQSYAAFSYPLLFKAMVDVFATDDTFTNFRVESIRVVQDNIAMDLSIETLLGQMVKGELSL